jgi:ERF superfamily
MKNIASALVRAQRGFAPALKTSTNPHFRSKYVDLAGCIEAVVDALNSAGIALIQRTSEDSTGVTVETVFVHESGETLECGKLHVPASKQDAQGYGSALTYARRYSLMAACGIAPEDDDGNAASKTPAPKVSATKTDLVPSHRMNVVADVAAAINERISANDLIGAVDEYSGITDVEEKMALWGMLDSKTRSAIKKQAESLKG